MVEVLKQEGLATNRCVNHSTEVAVICGMIQAMEDPGHESSGGPDWTLCGGPPLLPYCFFFFAIHSHINVTSTTSTSKLVSNLQISVGSSIKARVVHGLRK